jgi:N-acetylmuramoyl-L-alanine amidase CwlA
MIPKEKWKQYGLPNMEVKGIVIHNTNNQKASAADLEKWMIENDTSQGTHFIVDHTEVRQVMPLDWSVWNTGKGMDFGNLHCISIEICSNPNNRLYLQGQSKAIDLIESLMHEFNLTKKDLYLHRDFNPNTNCPSQILSMYGNKKNFLSMIKETR